jgi:Swt1-like HEPN
MAQSNLERVGKALELLNRGLQPYVERELKAVCSQRWMDTARESLREDRGDGGAFHWDTPGDPGRDVEPVERGLQE